MDPKRWQKVKDLFAAVADKPSQQQQAYLSQHCDDDSIRDEVLQLLKAENEPAKGLSTVMLESAKDLVVKQNHLSSGDRIGPYEIDYAIGDGGMGVVYLAHRIDKQFDQQVAIKFSRQSLQSDNLSTQLILERQLLGQLEHPNIARIYDAGVSADDHPYMVMEYIQGTAIDAYCEEHELNFDKRLDLVSKICQAIQYAHQKGIIHRDIKPDNILITEVDGEAFPKVIDFGIAHSDKGGINNIRKIALHSGTPMYMSPEQFSESGLSTQSDVYSIGLVLYRLLCGGLPFNDAGANINQIAEQKQKAILPPNQFLQKNQNKNSVAKMPAELNAIIVKSCSPEIEDRYQNVSELSEDIARYRKNIPVTAMPRSRSYWLKKFVQRHRYVVASVSLIFVSLMVAVGISLNALIGERQARQETALESEKVQAINDYLVDMIGAVDPRRKGIEVKVIDMLDRAEKNIEEKFAGQALVRASLYSIFGETRQGLGEYERAKDLIQQSIDLYQQELGENHIDTLTARNLYAENLGSMQQTTEALEIFSDVLEKCRTLLGNEHPLTLTLINNTAVNYYFRGYDTDDELLKQQSLSLMEELLASRIRLLGKNHEDTSHARNNLATMSESFGDADRASVLYRENLAIQLEVFGEANYFTLATMSNLANNLRKQNQLEEALQLARRSVSGMVEVQGSVHADTQRSRMVLLQILVALNSDSQAAEVLDELAPFLIEDDSRTSWLNDEAFEFYQQRQLTRSQADE